MISKKVNTDRQKKLILKCIPLPSSFFDFMRIYLRIIYFLNKIQIIEGQIFCACEYLLINQHYFYEILIIFMNASTSYLVLLFSLVDRTDCATYVQLIFIKLHLLNLWNVFLTLFSILHLMSLKYRLNLSFFFFDIQEHLAFQLSLPLIVTFLNARFCLLSLISKTDPP